MSDTKIAYRYAKSLFDRATETGVIDQVASDIRNLNDLIAGSRDFKRFLQSPLISRDTKKNTLGKLFTSYHRETLNLFELMTDKNREAFIGLMGEEFMKIFNIANGITVALVTSAAPMDQESMSRVEQFVKLKTGAKSVQIRAKVDPSIIGGITVMFEGKIYDSSIASQIKKIKKELNIA